jgi:ribose transport system substrate-binding protein
MRIVRPGWWGLAALLAVLAGGPATAADKRIVLLTNGNSPFWDAARFGLQEAEKSRKLAEAGLQAVMEVNDGTPNGQINKLRQLGTQGDIVGVAVSALDADNAAVANEMRKLRKKGVHIICVDADVNRTRYRDARAYYIGTDNVRGGEALGAAAKGLLEAKKVKSGSYVQFVGRTGSHNARERMDGFKQTVGKAYREADRMGDNLNRIKAQDNVRNAITNHPDLVALVGIWSYNAPAITTVVEEKKAREKYVVVAFDAEPLAIKAMAQGQIDAMVVQDPYRMGQETVRLLKALYENDQATVKKMFPKAGKEGDIYDTGLKVVVPDAKSPLTAKMFDSNVQFMVLADFQKWLDKYNLKGS